MTYKITSFGEERAYLSDFRTFVQFALVWYCLFPIPLGVGLWHWTFLLHFIISKSVGVQQLDSSASAFLLNLHRYFISVFV